MFDAQPTYLRVAYVHSLMDDPRCYEDARMEFDMQHFVLFAVTRLAGLRHATRGLQRYIIMMRRTGYPTQHGAAELVGACWFPAVRKGKTSGAYGGNKVTWGA